MTGDDRDAEYRLLGEGFSAGGWQLSTFNEQAVSMSCPLFIELPPSLTPLRVLDVLRSAGVTPECCGDQQDGEAYICRRGSASFRMVIYERDGRTLAKFTADLSRWRWWNSPIMWLLSIPSTHREVQLQRDAYFALRNAGAKRSGGGEILGLGDENAL